MPERTTWKIIYFTLLTMVFDISAVSQNSDYPHVHQEYYHQPVFENDELRVLNVRASKGDTTAFHRHCNPILYITIQGTEVSLQEESSPWESVELPSGWIGENIYNADSCFIHRFAVSGAGNLQIVAIEALKKSFPVSGDFDPIYQENGFSVFKLSSFSFLSFTKLAAPVVLVELDCENSCGVKIVSADELSASLFEMHHGYIISYEAQL